MSIGAEYGRVLIAHLPYRRFRSDSHSVMIPDGSALPFIVEEMVAVAVCEIVIPDFSFPAQHAERLPPNLKRRVRVKKSMDVLNERNTLFAPLAEEFGLVQEDMFICEGTSPLQPGLLESLKSVYSLLLPFLLGLRFQSHIEFDLPSLKRAVGEVRSVARSEESRTLLATLEGLLSTYGELSGPELRFVSSAATGSLEMFYKLVEDLKYQELSHESYLLGIPGRAKVAAQTMKRLARNLVRRRMFRPILNLGSQAMSVATGAPVPGAEFAEELLGVDYLPPVVSLERPLAAAIESWERTNPAPILGPEEEVQYQDFEAEDLSTPQDGGDGRSARKGENSRE